MPFAKIEPTGCGIHKGRAKLRLDFFLNPDDPNYDKHHVYVVDETSKEYQRGYKGKVDDEGNPLDLEDYQKWEDGLPHVWRDNPFHSHFIYPDKDVGDADIKAKIESCLNYFYAFHQHCWDEGKEFIEEWKKVPHVKGSVRDVFIKGEPKDLSANQDKVQDILSRSQEFQIGVSKVPPQDLNIGEKGTIDVGSPAINRATYRYLYKTPPGAAYYATNVERANPANADGEIDTVEAWFDVALSGNSVKYGTFEHLGSNVLKCHDAELYGSVSSGSKQTCSGLSIDISTGEYIGADARTAIRLRIDIASSGGEDIWHVYPGQFCDPNDQTTFSLDINAIMSLYGTGTEPAPPPNHRRSSFFKMF